MAFEEPKPYRVRSVQPPPYHSPLPYVMSYQREVETVGSFQRLVYSGLADPFGDRAKNQRNKAVNKALSDYLEQANQAADLAVAMIERRQTIKMVADGVQALVRVARAVKRRDPKIVRAIKRRQSKGEDIAKDSAGLWLQYHFGIMPTISDIHHGIGLLGYDFPVYKLIGTGGSVFNHARTYDEWILRVSESSTIDFRAKVGAEIRGINPDRHLVSMFGFDQPLSIALELTPFSWFLEYFVNVGELAANLEPRSPGVTTKNEYLTVFGQGHSFKQKTEKSGALYSHMTGQHDSMKRTSGLPDYKLTFSSPLDLSGQRLSYITAVLVGLLSSFKK